MDNSTSQPSNTDATNRSTTDSQTVVQNNAPQPRDNGRGEGSKPKSQHAKQNKGNIICRYYQSSGGCRHGAECNFLHTSPNSTGEDGRRNRLSASKVYGTTENSGVTLPGSSVSAPHQQQQRRYNAAAPSARIVPRPVPRAEIADPRGFQIDQLSRRYSPSEASNSDGTTELSFKLAPSDPDFPFELAALQCTVSVPLAFPNVRPTLRVRNSEMGRGYQINVEKGFDEIVEKNPKGTLLSWMKALDRDLERLLATPKAETIKLVSNAGKKPSDLTDRPVNAASAYNSTSQASKTPQLAKTLQLVSERPVLPKYSSIDLEKAAGRRESETRQLEARLSRLPLYVKSADSISYTVPIEPRRRQELPASMQALKSVKLIVPALYNLEPCRLELPGMDSKDVSILQENFREFVLQSPEMSLFAIVNRLAQTMHSMVLPSTASTKDEETARDNHRDDLLKETERSGQTSEAPRIGDKSHIIVIPRPPEWSQGVEDGEDSNSDDLSDASELLEEPSSGEEGAVHAETAGSTGPERGILMSFPNLELYGIELLELVSLSITIRCDRCKETVDVNNIGNHTEKDASAVKSVVCKKCSNQMGVGYRMDLMHANCIRAGYLDLDGCTVIDMLPSYFKPTCAECSTPLPSPGVVSVRAESTMAICRECHKRMSFKIPEIKFLRVSAAAVRASQAPRRKKQEKLGIKAGENLPNRGRCKHYSKSYRWFRFSCCNKVFPCDKCHDIVNDHPIEHANRMICGYCSREQNYRPEDCGVCHASLIAKRGTGFWEGGKGTRDKVRMSRKDPRKYKRRPGTTGVDK